MTAVLERAMQHKNLSKAEQLELGRKAAEGDSRARDKLVRGNLKLVNKVARKYARTNPGLDLDDLLGAGMLGLVESLDTFDPSLGVKFTTHAIYRIRALVIRFVVQNRSIVRIKRGERERILLKVSATTAELVAAGEEPTPERIAEVLGTTAAMVEEIQIRIGPGAETSLDKPVGHDEGSATGVDMLADQNAVSGDTLAEAQWRIQITERIKSALAEMSLSERDLSIGLHRFKPDPVDVRTLGDALGCSRGTVSNVEKRLRPRLAKRLVDLHDAI